MVNEVQEDDEEGEMVEAWEALLDSARYGDLEDVRALLQLDPGLAASSRDPRSGNTGLYFFHLQHQLKLTLEMQHCTWRQAMDT